MKSLVITIFSFLSILSASAQTADDIVAKHINAIGGKDVMGKTTSLYLETSTTAMGNDAPGKIYILNGKGYKSEMEMMGQTMTQSVNTKGGWSTNPMSNGEVADMPADQYTSAVSNMWVGGVFNDYAAQGTTIELQGKQKLDNGVEAYKLKVTPKNGKAVFYYIDPTTYYVTRIESTAQMMGQETNVVTTFSDYKKLDNGLVIAYSTNIDMGQFAMSSKVTKAEVNKPINEKIFDKK